MKDIDIRIWTNPLIKGIEFANIRYYNHSFKPHFHDHYVIITLKKGVNIGECQRQPYAITSSDVLIINPSEVHTGSSWQEKYLDYVALYVPVQFFSFTEHAVWFQKTIIQNTELAAQLRNIVLESGNNYSVSLQEELTLFFEKLFENCNGAVLSTDNKLYCRQSVKKGVEFIKHHYAEPVSVSNYCKQENISCYSFIRSFQKFTGLTPGQFLINYRVEKAKHLLQQRFSVADACWDTGFFDQSHFNRHFKLITGATPGQYRKCFVNT